MQYRESRPSPELARVIKHFWSLQVEGASAEPEVILPDGCPEIVFNLADRFRRIHGRSTELQPLTLFAGQIDRRLTIEPTGMVKLFGVRLTPTGAYAISRVSQSELVNTTPAFSLLFGKQGEELEDAINSAGTFESRINVVETFIRKRVEIAGSPSCVTEEAANRIIRDGGNASIRDLASILGRSERSLERDFREKVGITPKMFSRIARFQNVVRVTEATSNRSMIATALNNGYFDQSHMIRDFNEFAGTSPLEFVRQRHRLSDLFTSAA